MTREGDELTKLQNGTQERTCEKRLWLGQYKRTSEERWHTALSKHPETWEAFVSIAKKRWGPDTLVEKGTDKVKPLDPGETIEAGDVQGYGSPSNSGAASIEKGQRLRRKASRSPDILPGQGALFNE
tara:strand:- start:92 stop:472 length:381 start_codon:yes stop_codon:yes gene_type:complete